jgi:hypothetical protein
MSTSRSNRFTSRKEPRYPLDKRLGGPQSRCGRFAEQTNLLPLLGLEPRFVQPRSVDSSPALWTCLLHTDVKQVRTAVACLQLYLLVP